MPPYSKFELSPSLSSQGRHVPFRAVGQFWTFSGYEAPRRPTIPYIRNSQSFNDFHNSLTLIPNLAIGEILFPRVSLLSKAKNSILEIIVNLYSLLYLMLTYLQVVEKGRPRLGSHTGNRASN